MPVEYRDSNPQSYVLYCTRLRLGAKDELIYLLVYRHLRLSYTVKNDITYNEMLPNKWSSLPRNVNKRSSLPRNISGRMIIDMKSEIRDSMQRIFGRIYLKIHLKTLLCRVKNRFCYC